jgi:hypothetical protein
MLCRSFAAFDSGTNPIRNLIGLIGNMSGGTKQAFRKASRGTGRTERFKVRLDGFVNMKRGKSSAGCNFLSNSLKIFWRVFTSHAYL